MLGVAGEELHFDDAALAWVEGFEAMESLIDGEDVGVGDGSGVGFAEFEVGGAGAAACSETGAGVVDEDVAHDGGGEGEELGAGGEVHIAGAEEADAGFVDEGRGLKSDIRGFVTESPAGEGAEFVVDVVEEQIAGGGIAGAPAVEQVDGVLRGLH